MFFCTHVILRKCKVRLKTLLFCHLFIYASQTHSSINWDVYVYSFHSFFVYDIIICMIYELFCIPLIPHFLPFSNMWGLICLNKIPILFNIEKILYHIFRIKYYDKPFKNMTLYLFLTLIVFFMKHEIFFEKLNSQNFLTFLLLFFFTVVHLWFTQHVVLFSIYIRATSVRIHLILCIEQRLRKRGLLFYMLNTDRDDAGTKWGG